MTDAPGLPSGRDFALFGAVPFVVTLIAIETFSSIHLFAGDFSHQFWPAGVRTLHGQSPYILGRREIHQGLAFPYPASTAWLFAAFALLPRLAGEVIATMICFLLLALTLRLGGVRDWRIYGVILLWAPVVNAWQSTNLTILLGLALMLIWRHRDRPAVAGPLAAAAASLKPLAWPYFLFLLATRRYRAFAYAVVTGAALNLVAFGLLGFDQISRYLTDASRVSDAFFRTSYTPVALMLRLGASEPLADLAGVLCAAAAAAACVAVGRRGDDRGALVLTVALTFLATPVIWMHYFALVLVPFALARPRLEPLWGLPIVLAICGSKSTSAWGIVLAFVVIGSLLIASTRRQAAV